MSSDPFFLLGSGLSQMFCYRNRKPAGSFMAGPSFLVTWCLLTEEGTKGSVFSVYSEDCWPSFPGSLRMETDCQCGSHASEPEVLSPTFDVGGWVERQSFSPMASNVFNHASTRRPEIGHRDRVWRLLEGGWNGEEAENSCPFHVWCLLPPSSPVLHLQVSQHPLGLRK